MCYWNEARRLYSGRQILRCQLLAERSCQRNTHHELHDIDPKVFIYHSTNSDASNPEPVQEVGVESIDNELDVVLRYMRSNKHTKGTGGTCEDT